MGGLRRFVFFEVHSDRAVTFTNWLREEYPAVRLFRGVDHEMTSEFLGEKAETCIPDTVRTLLATLKKLQEGLYDMNWIREDIVPAEWNASGRNPPRRPYASDEAKALQQWVETRNAACEFVDLKRALGYTEAEARRELATPAPHATACGAVQVCGWDTIPIARK